MIYITGDTHGTWDWRKRVLQSLNPEDVVICLGDLGWSWDEYHIKTFQPKCEWLSVLGNHENYSIIETLPIIEKYGGKVRQLKSNVFYLLNGEMYEIAGKKFFVFGGALSIDKHWRRPYISWWPQEQPATGEYYHALDTLKKNNWTFDYFLTHTAEDGLAEIVLGHDCIPDSTGSQISSLKYEIKEHNGNFKAHYFGHFHQFWKSKTEDYEWYCLFDQIVNLEENSIKFG